MVITCRNASHAEALATDYREYIGRDVLIDRKTNTITVLALPLDYKKKREREHRMKQNREHTREDWEARYAEYS